MRVTLNYSEMIQAGQIGVCRQAANVAKGLKDRYGASPEDGWSLHITGALGEVAVAKAYNLFWHGTLGQYGATDVGGLVEVRTCLKPSHSLILHPDDADERPFVLVHVAAPVCTILGWTLGKRGKDQRFWRDPGTGRPAFFVPRDALFQPESLKALIKVRLIDEGAAA